MPDIPSLVARIEAELGHAERCIAEERKRYPARTNLTLEGIADDIGRARAALVELAGRAEAPCPFCGSTRLSASAPQPGSDHD